MNKIISLRKGGGDRPHRPPMDPPLLDNHVIQIILKKRQQIHDVQFFTHTLPKQLHSVHLELIQGAQC